jgi:hypothetical protein
MKENDAIKIALYFLLRKVFGKHTPDEDEQKLLDRAIEKLNI